MLIDKLHRCGDVGSLTSFDGTDDGKYKLKSCKIKLHSRTVYTVYISVLLGRSSVATEDGLKLYIYINSLKY